MKVLGSNKNFIKLPLLRLEGTDHLEESYLLSGDPHDLYILGDDGGLHYLNIQAMVGTQYGEVKFKAEYNELWGLNVFEKIDFLGLMDLEAKRLKIEEDQEYLKLKAAVKSYFEEAVKIDEERTLKGIEEAIKAFGRWAEDEQGLQEL